MFRKLAILAVVAASSSSSSFLNEANAECVTSNISAESTLLPSEVTLVVPKFVGLQVNIKVNQPVNNLVASGTAALSNAKAVLTIDSAGGGAVLASVTRSEQNAGESTTMINAVTKTMMASSFLMIRTKAEAAALVGMFACLSVPLPSSAQSVCEKENIVVDINLPPQVTFQEINLGAGNENSRKFTLLGPPTNAPTTDSPTTKAPTTKAPTTKAPTTSAPITDAPTNAIITSAPVTKAPVTKAPVTSAPVTKAPVTKAPVTSAPVTKAPVTSAPTLANAFKIQLVHLITPAPAVDTAFQKAAARWGQVITSNLPQINLPNGLSASSVCGNTIPANKVPAFIDDLLIVTSLNPIDGVGRVLGSAGPCTVLGGTSLGLTRIGFMQFDTDDLQRMINDGSIEGVILHEMGHVIGVGTLWRGKGLIQGSGTTDPRFTGVNGNNALKKIGDNVAQANIEADGGPGTAEGHWDEAKYKNELMTGFVNANMKLSSLTVESLIDMGYTVNIGAADAFNLATAGRRQLRGEEVDRELQTAPEQWDTMYTSYKVCPENWQGPGVDTCVDSP